MPNTKRKYKIKRIVLDVPEEMVEKIDRMAEKQLRTRVSTIIKILEEAIKNDWSSKSSNSLQ